MVTGCGRSGTTMLFDLIKANIQTIALNEPRLLYLQKTSHFDMWSKSATGDLFDAEHLASEYFESLCNIYPNSTLPYLEKMPEHALRPNFLENLSQLVNLKVVNIHRCWVDVCFSIS